MWRLGLRLALRSGREGLTRLLLISLAVMIGVIILLSALAGYNGFQTANHKPHWWFPEASDTGSLLWLYRTDAYKSKDIKRVDVALLRENSPIIPGLQRTPNAGEYYVSPALDKLLKSTPKPELGNRFQGRQAGIIGKEALLNPQELVAIVGHSPEELSKWPQVFQVASLPNAPTPHRQTNFFNLLFAVGAISILFPIFVLITMATRLSASRREERYAAIRLAGATPRQIRVIATADALLGATLGTLLGICVFLALRQLISSAALHSLPYDPSDITPHIRGYVLVGLSVPILSVISALLSLRKVEISPLGVSRKGVIKTPHFWSVLPLVFGLVIFVPGAAADNGLVLGLGFLLIMIGLITSGAWLTMRITAFIAPRANSAASLIATRRLATNPKSAFRSVSGLILAIFVGTVFAGIAPTVLADQQRPEVTAMENVLTAGFYNEGSEGLPPDEGQKILRELQALPDTKVFPVYAIPSSPNHNSDEAMAKHADAGIDHSDMREGYLSCEAVTQLKAMGQCPKDAEQAAFFTFPLAIDRNITAAQVRPGATASNVDVEKLPLQAVLVRSSNASSIEQARTILITHTVTTETPRTYGEMRDYDLRLVAGIQRILYVVISMTMLVAGASLLIAVSDGLLERKRSFTLLRLSGTPVITLNKVVLLESASPLLVSSFAAAVVGFGVAATLVKTIAPAGSAIQSPAASYYITLLVSILASIGIICFSLPLLKRITKPSEARFE